MFNYFSLIQNHAIYSKTDITLKEVPRKNFCKKLFFNFEKKYGIFNQKYILDVMQFYQNLEFISVHILGKNHLLKQKKSN
jgi:hypothetical protein